MDAKILSFKYDFFFLTFGFLMKMELLQQQKSVWVNENRKGRTFTRTKSS